MNKHVLTLITMLVISFSLHAQSSTQIDGTWTLNESKGGVSFYHKVIQCNGVDAAVLAFRNTNPNSVLVSWKEELVIDGNVRTLENSMRTIYLKSGELIQVDCTPKDIPFLLVPISNYPGSNLSINKYNYTSASVHTN